MNSQMKQFSRSLDQLLGIHPGQINPAFTSSQDESALQIAGLLKGMDFDSELAPRTDVRSRWMSQTQAMTPPTRRLFTVRTAWLAALIIALALLITFRQPVLAAVSHLFGYIYVQDAGFLPADSTMVLQQPVRQEHARQSLTATRGIATPSEITLWLEYSETARPVDGATLTTESGPRLEVSYWEYFPNLPDTHGVVMHFPPLPTGTTQTTLSLPEGWQIPLEWIPASQSHLPDVRAAPYPASIAHEATAFPDVTPEQELPRKNPGMICQEKHGMQLCLLAATASAPHAATGTTSEITSVLVQTQSLISVLSEKVWFGPIWQAGVTLSDAKGNVYPLNSYQNGTLLFPPISANQIVTLTVPAVLASLDISGQSIRVDLGSNPQPNTIIPLDVTIPIIGTSVHFSKATFVGDGVSSLRLTLDADSVQSVNGITPISIEIGKPDRVDDLYGGGMLEGSKDIFIELIQPTGKISGIINIPLDKAIVTVQGPFEFSFNLPEAASISPTPALADPNTFSPAPTATPLPLDDYAYSGQTLQPGDLLYTVLNPAKGLRGFGDNTNVYVFPGRATGVSLTLDALPGKETPGAEQSRLLVTLPGAVSQIYVHPDRQGLDYLAGTNEFKDGFSYIDNIRLYTLRFAEPLPKDLYSFASNPANTIGTTVNADWSYDGKYLAFRDVDNLLPGVQQRLGWFDMICRSNEDCIAHEIPIHQNWSLSPPTFAPRDYRMLFSGADETGTGEPDIFLLDFDPKKPNHPIVNITTDLFISGGNNTAIWTPDGKIFNICFDGMSQAANKFCIIDPVTGSVTMGNLMAPNLNGYRLFGGILWLSPSGSQVAATIFPENGTRYSIQELRLLDLNGRLGTKLAATLSIAHVSFSPSGEWLAYVTDDESKLEIAGVNVGLSVPVQTNAAPWSISWVGWVR